MADQEQQMRNMVAAAMQQAMVALFQNPGQNVMVQNLVQQEVQRQTDAAAAAAQLPPPPALPAAAPFLTDPALAANAAWDLTTSTGLKIYFVAVEPFKILFDGTEIKLSDFLRKVSLRADTFGFPMILTVADDSNTERDITKEYGCVTKANVQDAAIAHFQTQDRSHQAQAMLAKMIQGSLEPKVVDRLSHRKDDYTVAVPQPLVVGAAPIDTVSGVCMLYELISMVSVQTRATVTSLLNKLDDLEGLMEECKSNIELFNSTIELTCDALHARRHDPPQLLSKLFMGYLSCADVEFRNYMLRKQEAYLDGTINLVDDQLMGLALEKFKIMFHDTKSWMKKSQQELEFIAMQNELTKLK